MLHIANGSIVTEEGLLPADLYIENEKIAAVGEAPAGAAVTERYDASGCILFPGFLDAHTHLEMESAGTVTADGYDSGSSAALAGGTSALLDFATQERGGSLAEALAAWHSRADGNCSCDYGFHMAVTDWNEATKQELAGLAGAGVTSLKAYMAYDNLRLTDSQLSELLAEAKRQGYLTGCHCELGDAVNDGVRALLAAGKTGPENHPLARPNSVEARAVRRFLLLARKQDAAAWVVHLSTREGLAEVREARARGTMVLVETCPQYLTLTDEVYSAPDFAGAKYVCSPPIRKKEDADALWKALRSGEVHIVSTDHCSFNFKGQKELGRGDFSKIPNGLPGIEHRPALLWSYGVDKGRISALQFQKLLSERPAKIFGLWGRKGALAPGFDADVTVWDPSFRGAITAAEQTQHVDYTPWEGFAVTGRAKAVFLRGALAAENGRVTKKRLGRYLMRDRVW